MLSCIINVSLSHPPQKSRDTFSSHNCKPRFSSIWFFIPFLTATMTWSSLACAITEAWVYVTHKLPISLIQDLQPVLTVLWWEVPLSPVRWRWGDQNNYTLHSSKICSNSKNASVPFHEIELQDTPTMLYSDSCNPPQNKFLLGLNSRKKNLVLFIHKCLLFSFLH